MSLYKSVLKSVVGPKSEYRMRGIWNHFMGESELRMLAKLVDCSRNAVDIGANKGVYTYHLERMVPHVYAYEPNPELADFLRATVADNVEVRQQGLSNSQGTARLSIPSVHGKENHGLARLGESDDGDRWFDVRIGRLDDESLENVGFIKIDVEGHEKKVIEGARRTLEQHRPILLVEIEQRHIDYPITEVFELIASNGYGGYFQEDGVEKEIARFSYDKHQRPFIARLEEGQYGLKGFVNNFIFKPV